MIWPVASFTITQGFHAGHQANDLAAPNGTTIVAPSKGIVDSIGTNPKYIGGLFVTIKGDNGYRYYMGHCRILNVSKGQLVTEGQKVAEVGLTGVTTGYHTHYQIWNTSGVLVDPSKVMQNQGGNVERINDGDLWLVADQCGLTVQNCKDLGAVGKTWKEWAYFLPTQQIYRDHSWKAQYMNTAAERDVLKTERDTVLYPYVDATCNKLGIPVKAEIPPTIAAIDALGNAKYEQVKEALYRKV